MRELHRCVTARDDLCENRSIYAATVLSRFTDMSIRLQLYPVPLYRDAVMKHTKI
ncbi:hypothetical protein Desti_0356 [Desulfomonile tiedjei DSM 6799]|uniref:Uncharacterized protein n=1 Tax=Desulfomonile tiedjei (strain ATCC 49306 / DSM 6799 / DCB-1) TaxID=706587 RepID=I4C0K2_DESTA|nr:hypothetical protein Desti_0356 [Desulfomonile tiedjei DSM 6799]